MYLREEEGIECYSPKARLREAKRVGLLTDEETVRGLEMIDDRNLTSHTYHQEVAEKIYKKLPAFFGLMKSLLKGIESES
ncbi:MAG: nucleotidyltransferase substrate binding protein [Bacteroidota bacterium]